MGWEGRSMVVPFAVLLLVMAPVAATAPAATYTSLCDRMAELGQQASRLHNRGEHDKATAVAAEIERLYRLAVDLDSTDPQAHITFATFLLNSNSPEQALAIWERAEQGVTPSVIANNPQLPAFLEGMKKDSLYAHYSMKKDQAYSEAQGNMQETLRWQANQLSVYPSPQIYYDRATVKVMMAEVRPEMITEAVDDFRKSQEAALRGWVAAQEALSIPCTTSKVVHGFDDDQVRREYMDGMGSDTYSVEVAGETVQYTPTAPFIAHLENVVLSGPDGVVVKNGCRQDLHIEDLAARYVGSRKDSDETRKAQQKLRQLLQAPDRLYKGRKTGEGKALSDWMATDQQDCQCRAFLPSAGIRTNLAANLQMMDVFGHRRKWFTPRPSSRPVIHHPNAVPLIDKAVLVVQFAGGQFYHWATEAVGRLLMVKDALTEHPDIKVVLPKDASSNRFISQFLNLLPFTIPPSQRLTHPGYPAPSLWVRSLMVPTWTPPARSPSDGSLEPATVAPASILRLIRSTYVPQNKGGKHGVVYLSRPRRSEMRVVVNDDEVVAAVEGVAGPVTRITSPKPLVETIQLFSGASAVVGIHGGALANAVFCSPPTVIVELGFRTPWSRDYTHLAAALGLQYRLVVVPPDERGVGLKNVTVDPSAVAATLSSALSEEEL